ncbi:MAG TPA: DUF3579 domain-containing protein [Casimicrobiaceae bacterium]|nr:DUF3579 domain-containing protein [Casimicrobiaceae bacterium]
MDQPRAQDVVIWGVTRAGRTFRPSDWNERLAGLTSAFHLSDRLAYSALVSPVSVAGVRALIVSGDLCAKEPRLYRFLLNFARDNDLLTTESATPITSVQQLTPPTPPRAPRRAGEPTEPV